jgi:hypothetical protein
MLVTWLAAVSILVKRLQDTFSWQSLSNVPHRFPGIDLALLHLGGTRIFKMIKVTIDGKDGLQMLGMIAPRDPDPLQRRRRVQVAAGGLPAGGASGRPGARHHLPKTMARPSASATCPLNKQHSLAFRDINFTFYYFSFEFNSIENFPLISAVDACQINYCLVR